jgi:hypothetical protein
MSQKDELATTAFVNVYNLQKSEDQKIVKTVYDLVEKER